MKTRTIRRLLLAVVIGWLAQSSQSTFAATLDENAFLKKLLLHVGSNICVSKEVDSVFERPREDRLIKPSDVKFRSFKWSFEDQDTGRAGLRMLAKFSFVGGASYEGIVRLYIHPKGGMFNSSGPWIFRGNMDYDANIERQGQKSDVDCTFIGLESFRKTNLRIPSYEFNPNYKD